MKPWILVAFIFFSAAALATPSMELEELRLQKRFGVGLSAAGPLSLFGVEADANLTEEISFSLGIGTGLHYSTFMAKVRCFLLGEWVSPYLSLGVARWWTSGTQEKKVSPSVLANKFLPPGYDLRKGFNIFMLVPAVGVQFMHPMGLAFFAEVQYLFKLFDMSNGTYAGMGIHYYF